MSCRSDTVQPRFVVIAGFVLANGEASTSSVGWSSVPETVKALSASLQAVDQDLQVAYRLAR